MEYQDMEDNNVKKMKSGLTQQQLAEIMERFTLITDPKAGTLDQASKHLKVILLGEELQFVKCIHYRDQGWLNTEVGNEFFQKQRERADNATKSDERGFYDMMKEIAMEMQHKTGVLKLQSSEDRPLKVLDICMAPGGYAAAAKALNPTAEIYGITLGAEDGGHHVIMDDCDLKDLVYHDVTLLVKELSDKSAPGTHPHTWSFSDDRPFASYKFDLVFCDGIKLRSHGIPTYRVECEELRLLTSQLILAMQRIVDNGTLIVLLRKIECWRSAYILYTFSKFASVQTFKPTCKHTSRGSFYMIATFVKPKEEGAKLAVQEWRDIWWQTTFGGKDGTGELLQEPSETSVGRLVEEFGGKLVELGRDIWRIQADALRRSTYAGDGNPNNLPVSYRGLWPRPQMAQNNHASGSSGAWRQRDNIPPTQDMAGGSTVSSGPGIRRGSMLSPWKNDENECPSGTPDNQRVYKPRYTPGQTRHEYNSESSPGYRGTSSNPGYIPQGHKTFGAGSPNDEGRQSLEKGDTARSSEIRSMNSWRRGP